MIYDIIPLLTLISSVVNLSINTVGVLYNITRHVNMPEYIPSNDKDDFVYSVNDNRKAN